MNQANKELANLQKKLESQKVDEERERLKKIQEEMERERMRKEEEERNKQKEEENRRMQVFALFI